MRVTIKTITGKTFEIDIQSNITVQELKQLIHVQDGIEVKEQRLVYAGKLIQDERTLGDYNVQDNTIIHLVYRLRGDVGEFDYCQASKNRTLLTINSITIKGYQYEPEQIVNLIQQLQGDQRASYFQTQINLPEDISKNIINFSNQRYLEAVEIGLSIQQIEDLKIPLKKSELIPLVGLEIVKKLENIFGTEYEIIIRRCQAYGKMMDFHLDTFSVKTLQLSLNDDSDYTGGRLMYATHKKIDIPKRNRGTVTIHDNKIVHGVNQLKSGIRYSLFLLQRE